jgi:hypothetical protein
VLALAVVLSVAPTDVWAGSLHAPVFSVAGLSESIRHSARAYGINQGLGATAGPTLAAIDARHNQGLATRALRSRPQVYGRVPVTAAPADGFDPAGSATERPAPVFRVASLGEGVTRAAPAYGINQGLGATAARTLAAIDARHQALPRAPRPRPQVPAQPPSTVAAADGFDLADAGIGAAAGLGGALLLLAGRRVARGQRRVAPAKQIEA